MQDHLKLHTSSINRKKRKDFVSWLNLSVISKCSVSDLFSFILVVHGTNVNAVCGALKAWTSRFLGQDDYTAPFTLRVTSLPSLLLLRIVMIPLSQNQATDTL